MDRSRGVRSAVSLRWNQFLRDIFRGDSSLQDLLQEIFGYILIPDASLQKMFWFVGEGANGKGVAIKVLESLIDKSNRTSVDIRHLHNPFVRAALHDKLLAVSGDFPMRFFGHEDLVKTIVGGDTIDAQEKYGPQFDFTPYSRFIFAMNTLPETKDVSRAFFRRVVIVPFNRVFSEAEQDPKLVDALRAELSGIFLWALNGLRRLAERSRFTECATSTYALNNYRHDHNTIGMFVEAECVLTEAAKCKGASIWSAYEIFCAESGVDALSRKEFAIQVKRSYPVTVRTHRWPGSETPERVYFGIGLRSGKEIL